MTYKDHRRYTIHYSPRVQSWYIRDRATGGYIEGGYTQEGARRAAHYHNYKNGPKGYAQRPHRSHKRKENPD